MYLKFDEKVRHFINTAKIQVQIRKNTAHRPKIRQQIKICKSGYKLQRRWELVSNKHKITALRSIYMVYCSKNGRRTHLKDRAIHM